MNNWTAIALRAPDKPPRCWVNLDNAAFVQVCHYHPGKEPEMFAGFSSGSFLLITGARIPEHWIPGWLLRPADFETLQPTGPTTEILINPDRLASIQWVPRDFHDPDTSWDLMATVDYPAGTRAQPPTLHVDHNDPKVQALCQGLVNPGDES